MGQVRNEYKTSVEKLKRKYYLKDLQAVKWSLKKYVFRIRTVFICLRIESSRRI
jgi:hypothetical protein